MKSLRQRLREGDTLLGQLVLEFFTPGIGPILDAAGLDFVMYDMEHGRLDLGPLEQMIASCRGSQIVPLVRVPDLNFSPLSRVLDLGARGVMVPRVETREQAETIVRALKYGPQGCRGVATGVAHDLYRMGGPEFFTQCNEDTLVILQIESVTAMQNLDAIASTPGVDALWVGQYDLSVSMELPGQFDHPRLNQAMDDVVSACRRHNIAAAFLPPNPEGAAHWLSKGFRMLSLGSDIGVFLDGMRKFRAYVTQLPAQRGAAS